MKIIYLTTEGISSTVFESQVYSLVKKFYSEKFDITLIIGQKWKARLSLKRFLSLRNTSFVKFVFMNERGNYNKIKKEIENNIVSNKKVILHARGPEAAYIALQVKQNKKNVEVIYDVRGYVEEEEIKHKNPIKAAHFEELNNILFNADIYYSFVSKTLYEVYKKRYPISKEKIIVSPSAYNDKIFNLSQEKQLKDMPKFIYVGGNQNYQCLDEMAKTFKDAGKSLSVVTKKKLDKEIRDKYKMHEFKHNLSQKEISEYLDNFDYGVLFRSNELFNEVATPTKISEYWGKGLKIIAFNSAGAYGSVISQNPELGYVVSSEDIKLIEDLRVIPYEEKKHISDFAKENFSLSRNYENYSNLYHNIVKSDQE